MQKDLKTESDKCDRERTFVIREGVKSVSNELSCFRA